MPHRERRRIEHRIPDRIAVNVDGMAVRDFGRFLREKALKVPGMNGRPRTQGAQS